MHTKVWAHRGASVQAPENTIEAFRLAIEQGADGIELDVQLTADGVVVAAHDEMLERVSDGKGFLRDYTLEQLKDLNFNCGKERYGVIRIPTLEEVFDLVKGTDLMINLELKTNMIPYEGIEEKVIQLTKQYRLEERIIYSSFQYDTIRKLRELAPESRLGMLFQHIWSDSSAYARYMGVDAIHPPITAFGDESFLDSCRKQRLDVHVWTVNSIEECKKMAQAGVEAIITDYPDKAVAAIARRADKNISAITA